MGQQLRLLAGQSRGLEFRSQHPCDVRMFPVTPSSQASTAIFRPLSAHRWLRLHTDMHVDLHRHVPEHVCMCSHAHTPLKTLYPGLLSWLVDKGAFHVSGDLSLTSRTHVRWTKRSSSAELSLNSTCTVACLPTDTMDIYNNNKTKIFISLW